METAGHRKLWRLFSALLLFISLVISAHFVGANSLNTGTIRIGTREHHPLYGEKEQDIPSSAVTDDEKDIDIIATYSDPSGAIQTSRVKMKDLSPSWILENPIDGNHEHLGSFQVPKMKDSNKGAATFEDVGQSNASHVVAEIENLYYRVSPMTPVRHRRKVLRNKRRAERLTKLIQENKESDRIMQAEAAIQKSKNENASVKGKYSIWRKDYESPNSDATLKLMRDQIIMAKAYANIAKSENRSTLYDSLMKHIRGSQSVVEEANADSDLHPRSLDIAKAMGHVLSIAKDQLYDSRTIARKLRLMLQSTEDNVSLLRKRSAFLIQVAAKTLPKPLHCLPLRLAADYFLYGYHMKMDVNKEKLEDPSLYHYAIFSDNVLATSVVVNSTVAHAIEPEKHVFHIVTDKLNFASMKMWFLVNGPQKATVQVENVDEFTWLNSSYCSVLRQLESARVKEYYFRANNPSTISVGSDHLKYRNPKYLSMLNHLRFYLPEVYPKLDKILFLDDDIVVQKDLTPLWSVDLNGLVNGAVETCKESFHRFDKYLNFSHPLIAENFDPNACGWAFGMNIFDLKQWRKRNITGIYHYWQDRNENRTLWKLGTLPPGLITFYNLTHPLDRSWHVLGLGYDPALNQTEIDNGAVVHYNGNYKPWLDLAVAKYKSYWSKYVQFDNYYLQLCNFTE